MKHKPSITKPVTYIVNGQETGAEYLLARAPKPKARPKKDAPAAFHKGYRVEGHPPGAIEEARAENARQWSQWNNHGAAYRALMLKEGQRSPDMWNEDLWRIRTKKKAVRARPYSVASAAEDCKALALRSGWTDVEVIELKAGTSAGMLFGESE